MPKFNTARRADRREPARKRRVRPTMPDHEVLKRLYQLLEESEPSVAVHVELIEQMRTVIDDIIDGHTLSPRRARMDFEEILDWIQCEGQDHPRCGVALLKFMGHLALALREQGEVRVPVTKAIELMIWCQGELAYLDIEGSDRQPSIVSTPKWMELVGSPVRIRLSNPIPPFGIRRGLMDGFDDLAGGSPPLAVKSE